MSPETSFLLQAIAWPLVLLLAWLLAVQWWVFAEAPLALLRGFPEICISIEL